VKKEGGDDFGWLFLLGIPPGPPEERDIKK
jgi:hypothetical protein